MNLREFSRIHSCKGVCCLNKVLTATNTVQLVAFYSIRRGPAHAYGETNLRIHYLFAETTGRNRVGEMSRRAEQPPSATGDVPAMFAGFTFSMRPPSSTASPPSAEAQPRRATQPPSPSPTPTEARNQTQPDAAVLQRQTNELNKLKAAVPPPHTCGICTRTIAAGTSALLPCCHPVCRPCVLQTVRSRPGSFSCPSCGALATGVTTVDAVAKLPADPFTEEAVTVTSPCTVCRDDDDHTLPAVKECQACRKQFCEDHANLHSRRPATKDHVLTALVTHTLLAQCSAHDKPLDVYCSTCRKPVCLACTVESHRAPQHDTGMLDKHVATLRTDIQRAQATAVERSNGLIVQLGLIQAALEGVSARQVRLTAEIEQSYTWLVQFIMEHKRTVLNELSTVTQSETASLTEAAEAYRQRWRALQGGIAMTERLTAPNGAAVTLGQLAAHVETHLTATSRAAVAPAPTLQRVEFLVTPEAEAAVKRPGMLVKRTAFGPNCTALGAGLKRATIVAGGRATLKLLTQAGDPVTIKAADKIDARLIPRGDSGGSFIAADVAADRSGNGSPAECEITYSVPFPGEYEFYINVNEQRVRGSPFLVTAVRTREFPFKMDGSGGGGIIAFLMKGSIQTTNLRPVKRSVRAIQPLNSTSAPSVSVKAFANDKEVNVDVAQFFLSTQNYNNYYNPDNANGNERVSIEVNLGKSSVLPCGYRFSVSQNERQYGRTLTDWRFEATWTTLREHKQDATLAANSYGAQAPGWQIERGVTFFSRFRITFQGAISAGGLCNFELYGHLDEADAAPVSNDEDTARSLHALYF